MRNDRERLHSSDIDLLELMGGLWRQRLMILVVALAVTAAAIAYAMLAKPIYEAKVYVAPPMSNEIADLNYGRTRTVQLEPVTVHQVWGIFLQHLQREELRRQFFTEVYLPSIKEQGATLSPGALYTGYLDTFEITAPKGNGDERASVAFLHADPSTAAAWAEEYVRRAGEAAKNEVVSNATKEAQVRARDLGQQIEALRDNGMRVREDKIKRLREALSIAEAIGLQNPPIITGEISAEVSARMDGELTYMRGTKALIAEIKNLESRSGEDPFIDNLRNMQLSQKFFENLNVRHDDIKVFRVDGGVELPERPIKPRKPLIVGLGFILGTGLGVMIALVREINLRGRQKSQALV